MKRALSGSFILIKVAESFGISYQILSQWKTKFMKITDSINSLKDKQIKNSEELKKLRKENIKLKDGNAALKKFAAMRSGEQNPK